MNEKKLSFLQQMTCTMGASAIAESITSPLDTIKTNLQANLNSNRNITSTIHNIYQVNGIIGFYQSWLPSVCRQVCSSGVRLGLYGYAREHLNGLETNIIGGKIILGAGCGLISSATALPFDNIKTRIQGNQGNIEVKTNDLVKKIWQSEGPSGFYRGFWQTAQRTCLISAVQLPTYFTLQDQFNRFDTIPLNVRTTMASVLTTVAVTSVVYPIDLCKTQVQTNSSLQQSTLTTMNKVIQQNGVKYLYRGWSVGLGRALPQFWLTTIFYENIKQYLSS